MLVLLIVLVAGAGVSANSPKRPLPGCPFPTGPYKPPKCGPNEYFELCSDACPPQNCSSLWSKYSCLDACCKPECRCKDGFLRDDKSGRCIRRDECFNPCGPLEHFVIRSSECQKTCANYKVTGPQSSCKPFTGCVCNEGRVRLNDDGTGICVLSKQCPARKCPIFEHWEDCPSVCKKETCISKNPDYKCLLPAIPLPCKPRCICDKGFLRNAFGNCIPENHCPVKKCPINEVWRCASMCPRDSCKTLEPGFKCPPGIISICIPACACKDGYLRNDKGRCIPRDLCPSSLRCGINEVAVECATAYPLQTCESVYSLYKPIEKVPCKPGCDCRPGYLRNKRKICVPSEFCPTVPQNQCGPNQEYKECGTACEPSCADLNNPNQICTDQCVTGCFCKKGFVKDDQGNCIPKDQCPNPLCTQPNESFAECGSGCGEKNCENYDKPDSGICPAVCRIGCFCNPGYVRNAYGVCVLPEQCPPKPVCLQANEEYQSCGSSCPDNCDNYKDTGRICTANCVPGCNCKQGYVRNLADKTCVKPEQCPSNNCTGLNEFLNPCASYCPVTCANRFTNGDWLCATVCRSGCDCNPGTLRNDNGVCVPVEQCTPPVCRQNEKYLNCGTACPLTCDNYKNPPKVCTLQCVEDCFCEEGYVRDRNMRCVKPENCEPICPAGEKFNECSAHCQDTCENFDKPDRICTYQCQSGCVCEEGTVRNKNGKCVPPLECSAQPTCPSTEVYSPCSAHCEPTCENSSPNQPCTRICKPGCKCIDGLVRRKDGQCVKVEECSVNQCTQPNEHYTECGSGCNDRNCENYNRTDIACPAVCIVGCFCNSGYVRDAKGVCIPIDQCPPPRCTQTNEYYTECGSACNDRNCDNYNRTDIACAAVCVPGCFCNPGHVRDQNGICIPSSQCPSPKCSQPYEYFTECGSDCNKRNCDDYNRTDIVCPAVCVVGCFCRAGYVRDAKGICIPIDQCPPTPPKCTQPNEYYTECGSACNNRNCDNYNRTDISCAAVCVVGCFCNSGYVRDANGVCIPIDQCPSPKCTQPNEYYTECGSSCNNRNCDDYKRTDIGCAAVCVVGCFCKTGYVRDAKGVCIPTDQCPPEPVCLQANEEYQSCGSSCPDNCDNYKDTGRICTANCVPGCNCKQGYVRNLVDKTCVKPEQCPQSQCSGDEVFDACSAHCEPTCENHAPNRPCTAICKPGCKCGEGLVRRKDGKCVKLKDCVVEPACPAQEVYDQCSAHCEPTCDNNGPNRPCIDICSPGCKCEDGLVRRSDGKCVKLEECKNTPQCPLNERWVNCVLGLCAPQKCDELGFPVACADIIGPCSGGCVCAENYLRNSEGVCIPQKDCPSCGGDFNATSGCGDHCGNRCSNYDKPNNCSSLPLFCQYNGCECKDGYVYDEAIEKCVSSSDCPNNNQPCSDPNAERVECGTQCPPTCANPIPGPCIASCKLNACVCKQGFILSEDGGKCVPVDQCPKDAPCNGDSNAVIKANPIPCPSTCAAPNASPYCKKYAPPVGCECKPGYLKSSDDFDGKCIKPEECTGGNPCGVNGTFVWCKVGCPTNNCPTSDSRAIIACSPPFPCPNGCACKLNYKRKSYDDDTCILAPDCPPVKCTRQNEVWSSCPSACLRENCEDIDNQPTTCNTLVWNCEPQCICKKGHFRNANGLCVPANQCPNKKQCSDPNAERVECAPAPQCRSTCAAPNPGPCILSCALNECVCKKGFVLSEKGGKCIPVDQCPKDAPCNGDANAVIKANPIPCPSTCAAPNAWPYCKKYAPPVGCECKPGYLQDDTGKCIKPDDCKGGNPCGANGNFVWCNAGCPTDYCPVNDNRGIIACSPPNPCPSGCACKPNYRKKSYEDPTCILASNCPPVNCTRQNEVWSKCVLSTACLQEDCSDANKRPSPCNFSDLNCKPQCICNRGHYRNSAGLCVPAKECPTPSCGLNEHYEINRSKCDLTCKNKDQQATIGICQETSGCFCDNGFYRNTNGICVTEKQCPKPIKCPANEVLSECYNSCLTTCKTRIRGDGRACSLACIDSGCVCKPDFLRHDNGTCVPISQCSPPRCNENETYSACGTACPETCLNRGGNCTSSCTKQCVEDCFCSKGFVRSDDGSCVKPKDCPKPTCSDPNEVFDKCPPTCPPGDNCSNLWSKFDCTKFENCCKPACRCKSGYYRNNGKCITTQQCIHGEDSTEGPVLLSPKKL